MVHGNCSGSPQREAPEPTNRCGIFFWFRYFWIADIARRAERGEHQENLVALDQLADLLDRLRRRIGIVVGDEVDLAAVDAALIVDHPEVGGIGLADDRVNRGRAAIGHRVADLDLGVGDADVVFLLGQCRSCGQNSNQCNRCEHNLGAGRHRVLPWLWMVRSCSSFHVLILLLLRERNCERAAQGQRRGQRKAVRLPPLRQM